MQLDAVIVRDLDALEKQKVHMLSGSLQSSGRVYK